MRGSSALPKSANVRASRGAPTTQAPCLTLALSLTNDSAKLGAAPPWGRFLLSGSPRLNAAGGGFLLPAGHRAKLACFGRVFARRVILASDDVARFTVWLRNQSGHDVATTDLERIGRAIDDVLADLERDHGAPIGLTVPPNLLARADEAIE